MTYQEYDESDYTHNYTDSNGKLYVTIHEAQEEQENIDEDLEDDHYFDSCNS